ncbi:dynein regulatory complex protein 9 [Scaptodrosophila lebanonensis]|uniref:Dynein regulatory complex protein 9 n=1 Tax=Drosophila lebanonensis TaxID=7225 RepID=A0A6J2T2A4_DROLE|nr:dynein regulatory complex protein 9 [Scaptodrosophila lebanonensis]
MESQPTYEGYSSEQLQAFQQALLAASYRDAEDKLRLQQRSQRMQMEKPLPALPASLRRRSSSSGGAKSLQSGERQLLTGKMLPRLESLLGEPAAEQVLHDSVLNSLKFQKDLDALRDVFELAATHLYAENEEEQEAAMEILEQAIKELSCNNSEEAQAALQLQQARDELKSLRAQVEQVKCDGVVELNAKDERIAESKYKLRCVSKVNDLEYNLVERWEAGRITQADIWGENAERAYLRDILDYKQRLEREQRVSGELQAFRSRELAELQQRIGEWQQKYASEMRRVDREAEAWEFRIIEVQKSLERHREVYEQRVAFVQDYRAKKDEEQRQHDLQLHRIECAVRLQAWWRGTMVRRGLGPFKKKPKKGRRGGKSKK